MIKSDELFALSRMAPCHGADVGALLNVLARAQAALEEADDRNRKLRHAEQRRAEAEALRKADVQRAQDALQAARDALGNGWHPLKSGGSMLIEKGELAKLCDEGDHSEKRHDAIWNEVKALGWKGYLTVGDPAWSDDGVAIVQRDEIPF